MKIGLIFFTETDCAGERKACLAQTEFDVAVVVRHRYGRAAIANVTDHAPPFAESFDVRIPEFAHGNFLGLRSCHQAEPAVDGKLKRDSSLPRLEFVSS